MGGGLVLFRRRAAFVVSAVSAQLVKNICKAGPAARERVLEWLAETLGGGEARAKAQHLHFLLTTNDEPESASTLHPMLLREQSVFAFLPLSVGLSDEEKKSLWLKRRLLGAVLFRGAGTDFLRV